MGGAVGLGIARAIRWTLHGMQLALAGPRTATASKGPDHETAGTHDTGTLHGLRSRLGDGTVRWRSAGPGPNPGPSAPVGDRRVRLVVAEEGAEGLAPYVSPNASSDAMVTRQSSEETPAEFAVRVIRKITSIETSGHGVAAAVILLAPRLDPQAMAARELLARALLVHAENRSDGLQRARSRCRRPGCPGPPPPADGTRRNPGRRARGSLYDDSHSF